MEQQTSKEVSTESERQKRRNRAEVLLQDLLRVEDATDRSLLCRVATHMAARHYRRERFGTWERDESYEGKSKAIFHCSLCGHWQSAKRREHTAFYRKYCPACGARMKNADGGGT